MPFMMPNKLLSLMYACFCHKHYWLKSFDWLYGEIMIVALSGMVLNVTDG